MNADNTVKFTLPVTAPAIPAQSLHTIPAGTETAPFKRRPALCRWPALNIVPAGTETAPFKRRPALCRWPALNIVPAGVVMVLAVPTRKGGRFI